MDDPVNAFPVHFGGGIIGVVAVGLFADDTIIQEYYQSKYAPDCGGLFYTVRALFLTLLLYLAQTDPASFPLLTTK